MRIAVRQVKSKDHPSDFNRIEVLVSFWRREDSPSYLTLFLKKSDDMTSDKIKALAVERTREFLSRIQYVQ